MKKVHVGIALSLILLLGACSGDSEKSAEQQGAINDGESVNGSGTVDHGIKETEVDKDKDGGAEVEDNKVGFSLSGEDIEEATGIPAKEKEQILLAFDAYIDTLNEKDVDGHLATLSKEAYDLDEEREFIEDQLGDYDVFREPSTITVVKYSETEAQVFSDIVTSFKQVSTGLETNPSGRQVTVFGKEDGEWKVISLHYIGDPEK